MKADDPIYARVEMTSTGQSNVIYGLMARDYIAIESPFTFTEAKELLVINNKGESISNELVIEFMAALNYTYADKMIKESNK